MLSSDEYSFSVELRINVCRLSAILESEYGAIPYWLLAEGLPVLSTPHDGGQTATCIVAVCNCGEYGCGHIQCDVWKTLIPSRSHRFTAIIGVRPKRSPTISHMRTTTVS